MDLILCKNELIVSYLCIYTGYCPQMAFYSFLFCSAFTTLNILSSVTYGDFIKLPDTGLNIALYSNHQCKINMLKSKVLVLECIIMFL